MRAHELLTEGINDKGIFKCLFLGGVPASGKSTFAAQAISVCDVKPKILNFDQFYEFLSIKHDIPIGSKADVDTTAGHDIRSRAKELTVAQLNHYLTGMLPLIVDTSAASIASLIERSSIIRSHGYDIMMIYKTIDVETAIERAAARDRYVDKEYIEKMHKTEEYRIDELSDYFQEKNSRFLVVDDSSIASALKETSKFFNSPVSNPMGIKKIKILTKIKEKTSPIRKSRVNQWY